MVWYYADGDRQRGPISDEEFQEMVNNGRIRRETLVWTDGMDNWQSLGKAHEIGHVTIPIPSSPVSQPAATPSATPTQPTSQAAPDAPSPAAAQVLADHCSQCGRGPLGIYDAVRLGNLTLCRDCDSDLARHYYQQNAVTGAPVAYPGASGPATGTATAPAAIYLASIPSRFFAKIIDQVITFIVMFIVMAMTVDIATMQELAGMLYDTSDTDQINSILDQINTHLRPAMLTGLIFRVCYDAVLVGAFGATLGKMALGIRIVSPDGSPARFSQAIIRAITPAILQLPNIMLSSKSLLPQFTSFFTILAYLIAIFDPEKRTLFDRLAGTRVVKNQ